jgi:hypothetical protein
MDARDAPLRAGQQLGGEVAERADDLGLDEVDLAVQEWLARIDLLWERVAVAGRPAIVHNPAGCHEVVGVLDIDAEERLVVAHLVGDVLDLDLVVEDHRATGPKPLRLEWHRRRNLGMQLVAH